MQKEFKNNKAPGIIPWQERQFRKDGAQDGAPFTIIATVRHDDRCGNGRNTFSITGEIYEQGRIPGESTILHKNGRKLYLHSCGYIHEEIAEHFPELRPFLKWHLCSTDGPLHYIANTVYLAGDLDCWKGRKGDPRGIHYYVKKGESCVLCIIPENGAHGSILGPKPIEYKDRESAAAAARNIGGEVIETIYSYHEGKDRELDKARDAAVWHDATDHDLISPGLADRLANRLPALLAEFRADVESLGMVFEGGSENV